MKIQIPKWLLWVIGTLLAAVIVWIGCFLFFGIVLSLAWVD